MLHAKTKHSTETQNLGWSTVHEVHIWTAAEVDQYIPLSSKPESYILVNKYPHTYKVIKYV